MMDLGTNNGAGKCGSGNGNHQEQRQQHVKSKLVDINPHLTCYLCKGYYIDATTISECLHSFCRSCIIKFLHENSHCPICEVIINKAKPNLKLDKTLQDIVYKLVPELFFNEMKRRQRFYQGHPELACKVTPEERGEDTERTIFNPRDTISLSIEYISDDASPGVIQLLHQQPPTTQSIDEENSSATLRRFLQCPGMCRVEVLKKFIRNKYNVDTFRFHIDILYKRVPLPDHYTLIDIAYIYSWKRNEPMKFFFKITDINLVTDNFDYLVKPQLAKETITKKEVTPPPPPPPSLPTPPPPTSTVPHKATKGRGAEDIVKKEETKKKDSSPIKDRNNRRRESPISRSKDRGEITNITLNRSNNLEIITKIQKVSNRNGLQIGIKITKHTVKKFAPSKTSTPTKTEVLTPPKTELVETSIKSEPAGNCPPVVIKQEKSDDDPPTPPPPSVIETTTEEDEKRKSDFLKSIELTARSEVVSPSKGAGDQRQTNSGSSSTVFKKMWSPPTTTASTNNTRKSDSGKRKMASPTKANKKAKKTCGDLDASKKELVAQQQNPDVMQMVKNVNENASSVLTKFLESQGNVGGGECSGGGKNSLQALLFDSYKINIPASLSVTVKNEKDEGPAAIKKPVQNFIEILKIPDGPLSAKTSPTTPTGGNKNEQPSPSEIEQVLEEKDQKSEGDANNKNFEKTVEETIKSSELDHKFRTNPATVKPPGKRKLSEIASNLIKKSCEINENQKKEPVAVLNVPSVSCGSKKHQRKSPVMSNRSERIACLSPLSPGTNNAPLKDFNTYISSKGAVSSNSSSSSALSQHHHVPLSPSLPSAHQTVASLHSPALGLNYSVSVTRSSSPRPAKRSLVGSPHPLSSSSSLSSSPAGRSPRTSTTTVTPPRVPPQQPTPLSTNQLLEKYNIQNLAQLTANFNFPANACVNPSASPSASVSGGVVLSNQLAAMHQALIYRHFEMQNHQNWLNMNPGPLMQYEKYVQSLTAAAAAVASSKSSTPTSS